MPVPLSSATTAAGRLEDGAVDDDVPAVAHDRHARRRSAQYIAMEVRGHDDDAADFTALQSRNRLLDAPCDAPGREPPAVASRSRSS